MKKATILLIILSVVLVQGCASLTKSRPLIENNKASEDSNQRFQIIQEQGETNNIGGLTVIKDTLTGKEYLVVTGLNGASTVTELQ